MLLHTDSTLVSLRSLKMHRCPIWRDSDVNGLGRGPGIRLVKSFPSDSNAQARSEPRDTSVLRSSAQPHLWFILAAPLQGSKDELVPLPGAVRVVKEQLRTYTATDSGETVGSLNVAFSV